MPTTINVATNREVRLRLSFQITVSTTYPADNSGVLSINRLVVFFLFLVFVSLLGDYCKRTV